MHCHKIFKYFKSRVFSLFVFDIVHCIYNKTFYPDNYECVEKRVLSVLSTLKRKHYSHKSDTWRDDDILFTSGVQVYK